MKKKGHIYIFTNDVHDVNWPLIKVGRTQNTPELRAKSLSRGAGVIGTWSVFWSLETNNCNLAESIAFHLLKQHRTWDNKEMFAINCCKALRIIEPKLMALFDIKTPGIVEDKIMDEIFATIEGLELLYVDEKNPKEKKELKELISDFSYVFNRHTFE